MPKPEKIILVCSNRRPPGHPRGSCGEVGASDVLNAFREEREARELNGKITATASGCLGPCNLGTVVTVMPDNVWYKEVQPGDVKEIMDSHIEAGAPVERLLIADSEWF
ncbi:MAG: (2Fe-2S) ferredoxin domain-containing protein [Deltaproteobacteria bacterium]|nr:(2Fe-2S) ferredoxin domain-containing protein [Deltaproteobacteria bacterium]